MKEDLVIYEEKQEAESEKELGLKTVVGSLLGGLFGFLLSTEHFTGPYPSSPTFQVQQTESGLTELRIKILLSSAAAAGIGALVGSFFEKKKKPRSIRLTRAEKE